MSVTEFFTFPRVRRRMYAGPLGPYVDAFTERLLQLGYSKRTIRDKIRVVAQFSRWLVRHDLRAADVDVARRKRFLAHRKRAGGWTSEDAAALRELQALLCEQGVTHVPDTQKTDSARERMALDFRVYLLTKRGLAPVTVQNYLRVVSCLLKECFVDDCARTELLTSTDVIGFVQRHAHSHGHSWAQSMVTALRAFLRYLHRYGKIPADLAACVPAVAGWSFSRLPAFLSPEETQRVLDTCDRRGPWDGATTQCFCCAPDSVCAPEKSRPCASMRLTGRVVAFPSAAKAAAGRRCLCSTRWARQSPSI